MNETETYKRLKDSKQTNFPEWLIIHHSGGTDLDPLADTSNHTAQIVESWHVQKGWNGVGYHYLILKDGSMWKGRPEQCEGAHTVGYNKKSLGILVMGNFDATMPTQAQIDTLKKLLIEKLGQYKLTKDKIVPHRKFANKTCFGNKLPDNWASSLVSEQQKTIEPAVCQPDNSGLLNKILGHLEEVAQIIKSLKK